MFVGAPGTTPTANPFDPETRASFSASDRYDAVLLHLRKGEWKKLLWEGEMLLQDFPDSTYAQEARYYMGIALFENADYAMARRRFSEYLQGNSSPRFFEEAIRYEFRIAQRLREGARRRLFGARGMPKWVHGYEDAVEIFDEVIAAFPRSDLAAESLHGKASLLAELKEYEKSIEAYRTLIRRFPIHTLAPESYLGIADVYLLKFRKAPSSHHSIDAAEINVRKFRAHFPGEPRLKGAEQKLAEMRNIMAADLLETGDFYKKTHHPEAAVVYYRTVLRKYPDTKAAERARKEVATSKEQGSRA